MAATQTLVRKIVVGTPVRRVVGAQAQRLNDLLDVTITNLEDDDVLQYDAATGLWRNEVFLDGGTF
jgi:hypothetical protein